MLFQQRLIKTLVCFAGTVLLLTSVPSYYFIVSLLWCWKLKKSKKTDLMVVLKMISHFKLIKMGRELFTFKISTKKYLMWCILIHKECGEKFVNTKGIRNSKKRWKLYKKYFKKSCLMIGRKLTVEKLLIYIYKWSSLQYLRRSLNLQYYSGSFPKLIQI